MVHGYRSGFEEEIARELAELNVKFTFEEHKVPWTDLRYRNYTPDFVLENGIIIETKGRFVPDDRRKHLEIKKQHPHLDIRFVFYRSASTLSKTSKTTYASWCKKNGFKYADKHIPQSWLDEPKKKSGLEQLKKNT